MTSSTQSKVTVVNSTAAQGSNGYADQIVDPILRVDTLYGTVTLLQELFMTQFKSRLEMKAGTLRSSEIVGFM